MDLPSYIWQKRVVIYLDDSARTDLARFGIFPTHILDCANRIFQEYNQLPFGYYTGLVPIMQWHHSVSASPIPSIVRNRLLREAREKQPDIPGSACLFVSGLLSRGDGGTGDSDFKAGLGSGVMVVGTAPEPDVTYTDALRRAHLWQIALACVHEQAHLFGIGHSEVPGTVMYFKGSGGRLFDEASRALFAEKIRLLMPR
ncbi:MAG: hypothetical protein KGI60_00570 [Patescibacteria group bacterium]|nr:hypothetical protein [Patescibacteria group bacterium]